MGEALRHPRGVYCADCKFFQGCNLAVYVPRTQQWCYWEGKSRFTPAVEQPELPGVEPKPVIRLEAAV